MYKALILVFVDVLDKQLRRELFLKIRWILQNSRVLIPIRCVRSVPVEFIENAEVD